MFSSENEAQSTAVCSVPGQALTQTAASLPPAQDTSVILRLRALCDRTTGHALL